MSFSHSSDEKHHNSNSNCNSDEERLHDEFSGSLEVGWKCAPLIEKSPVERNYRQIKQSRLIQDLVGNFDEKIAACLKDHEVTTADIAPVQIRTQEEVMNESQ